MSNLDIPDELVADVTAIFVQPHFDDVALSIGGIAALHTKGQVGLNVTLFAATPDRDVQVSEFARVVEAAYTTDDFSRQALWELRRREDDEAAKILRVRSLRLPYVDVIYRSPNYDSIEAIMTGEIQSCDEPLIDQIASDLLEIWQRTRQAVVYLPLAVGDREGRGGAHIDHRICHQAGVRSLIRAGASVWFYEDFPYAFWWPNAVEKRRTALGRPLEKNEVDITSVLPIRLRAIEAYRSQLDAMFAKFGGFEHAVKQYSRVTDACFVERLWRFRDAIPVAP